MVMKMKKNNGKTPIEVHYQRYVKAAMEMEQHQTDPEFVERLNREGGIVIKDTWTKPIEHHDETYEMATKIADGLASKDRLIYLLWMEDDFCLGDLELGNNLRFISLMRQSFFNRMECPEELADEIKNAVMKLYDKEADRLIVEQLKWIEEMKKQDAESFGKYLGEDGI